MQSSLNCVVTQVFNADARQTEKLLLMLISAPFKLHSDKDIRLNDDPGIRCDICVFVHDNQTNRVMLVLSKLEYEADSMLSLLPIINLR